MLILNFLVIDLSTDLKDLAVKKLLLIKTLFISVFLHGCAAVQKQSAEEFELDTLSKKVSYAVGLNIARQFENLEFDLDYVALANAINDFQSGGAWRMTNDGIKATFEEVRKIKADKLKADELVQTEERLSKALLNLENSKKFHVANAIKEGVLTTTSGLQYKVLEEGRGSKPKATDMVTVHYRGRLLDGTEFDNSYDRAQPARVPVNKVIEGWVEALQLMNVGSRWELYIPPHLAYREGGALGVIGPNETLIFEVELLEIN